MPKKVIACTICSHPDANEITKRLLQGEPLRPLGDKYGVDKSSLSRHKRNCLFHSKIVVQRREKLAKNVLTVFDKLQRLADRFDAGMSLAEQEGQMAGVASFGRELRETLKSVHEIGKESQDAGFAMNIVDQALPERCPHCNARLTQCELSDTR